MWAGKRGCSLFVQMMMTTVQLNQAQKKRLEQNEKGKERKGNNKGKERKNKKREVRRKTWMGEGKRNLR